MSSLKKLGALVFGLGLAQLFLYIGATFPGHDVLFYFDPRIGLLAFQSMIGREPNRPGLVQWLAACWELGIGLGLFATRASALVYMVAEAILAVPSLAFFLLVIVSNVTPSHGFSVFELLIPLPVFGMFSVLPFLIARRVHTETQANARMVRRGR